jgi:hypothetical protein
MYNGLACLPKVSVGRGSGTYWRALKVGGECGLTMCAAAGLAKAIGIPAYAAASADREAESTKCVGRSEAGLVANSPWPQALPQKKRCLPTSLLLH